MNSQKQFQQAFQDRLRDINTALEVKRPADHSEYLKKLLTQINELKELTKDFELEAANDQNARTVLKDCNAKLRQLKQQYGDKENELSRLQQRELLGDGEEEIDDEDPQASAILHQKRLLQDGRKSLGQAIEHGQNIGTELERQRQKLSKSLQTTNEITADLGVSTSLIGSIERIRNKNKLIYYGVVSLLFLFLFYLVARLFF